MHLATIVYPIGVVDGVDTVETGDNSDVKSNDDTQKETVSEPENQKDEEVSSTNSKPMTQRKKKTSSTKRLKKGPKTVKDAKA